MRLALWAAITMAGTAAACAAFEPRIERRLVILGLDGLDAELTERWIAAGLLPNLAALAAQGGIARVETTPSADTANAWVTWTTGVGAGVHGVFDAVDATAESRLMRPTPSRLLFDRWPMSAPGFAPTPRPPSFWSIAAGAGVAASVMAVPGTFPPEPLSRGEVLSGFPLPAIDDSPGTYAWFASDLRHPEPADAAFPARRRQLEFVNRVAAAELPGLQRPAPVAVPFRVTWNHEARTVNIDIAGETVHLIEGQWSRWIAVPFRVGALVTVQGMTQFYLHHAGVDLQLYASPIQWHPADPPAPMSSPPTLSAELYERIGPFRTVTHPGTARALANGDIDDQIFLDDLDRAFDDRAAIILNRLEQRGWNLAIGVVDATDDVQHLMWRLIDPFHPAYDPDLANRHGGAIQRMYRRADELVGQVRSRLPQDAVLIVFSAYGFHPIRTTVDLNAWLAARGYGASARAVGAGQVFVDRRAPDRQAIIAGIRGGLAALVDLSTGSRIVAVVGTGGELYPGPRSGDAPDLVVGFSRGYGASPGTSAGTGARPVIAANRGRWSGDHAAADWRDTPGIFVANVKPAAAHLRLVDFAPAVLKYFGVAVPPSLDGTPAFGEVQSSR